jgi:RNA polymerase sigma factor (sigma-70 family)
VPAATLTTRVPLRPLRSKRLLALAGDERLVEQIRRGNELAFEVAFERHGTGILAFCRHMLGSREEAEDAVQHTFAAAFKDLQRPGERRVALKAWLYTIARNRCVSVLRVRREQAAELHDVPTDGLSEEVERRAELRELLADVGELPEEQRTALLLAEAAGLSHAEVAEVLGCEVASVKGLVFRARSALIERRVARDTSCDEIREQLATLRGGALRRNELRHHLRSCPGCSAYRDEVRRQRQMLAAALPVTPSLGLKGSVMGAAGLGGSAIGGVSAGGAALGTAVVAKVAIVGVLAGGSVVAGEVVVHQEMQRDAAPQLAPAAAGARDGVGAPAAAHPPAEVETRGLHGGAISGERNHSRRADERRAARSREGGNAGSRARTGDERTSSAGRRRLGQEKRAEPAAGDTRDGSPGQRSGTTAEASTDAPVKPDIQQRSVMPTRSVPALPVDESADAAVPLADAAPVRKVAPPEVGQ